MTNKNKVTALFDKQLPKVKILFGEAEINLQTWTSRLSWELDIKGNVYLCGDINDTDTKILLGNIALTAEQIEKIRVYNITVFGDLSEENAIMFEDFLSFHPNGTPRYFETITIDLVDEILSRLEAFKITEKDGKQLTLDCYEPYIYYLTTEEDE